MYLKIFWGIVLISLLDTISYAQINNDRFVAFAEKNSDMLIQAYESKNANKYKLHLDELLAEYSKLDSLKKSEHSGYIQIAYYNLTCLLSLIGNVDAAVMYFKKAVDYGYYDYYHVIEDTDLDNIRENNEFKKSIEDIRKIGDYVFILKSGAKYNVNDSREIPQFEYQTAKSPYLVELRKKYNLDSVVANYSEVHQILTLLHWVHNNLPHNGTIAMKYYNANDLLTGCKKGGVNCRGLASALNEIYLSMGFPSRIVTCMPKDSLNIDNDCHVINTVYSKELNKWLWMDPTNDVYLMDEKGALQSIEEVREKIINGTTLILNPDANWNNKNSVQKDYYLKYMAKNLYKLRSPVVSTYNMENPQVNKKINYIELLPEAYLSNTIDYTEKNNSNTNVKYVTFRTSNFRKFWELP